MVIVTSHEFGISLVLKTTLSHAIIANIAGAFTVGEKTSFMNTLRTVFGEHEFERFCYDIIDNTALITFSKDKKASVVTRNGNPVQVDPQHAAPFRIFLTETVGVRVGRLARASTFVERSLRTYDLLDNDEDESTHED